MTADGQGADPKTLRIRRTPFGRLLADRRGGNLCGTAFTDQTFRLSDKRAGGTQLGFGVQANWL